MPAGYNAWPLLWGVLVVAFVICIAIAAVDEWRQPR